MSQITKNYRNCWGISGKRENTPGHIYKRGQICYDEANLEGIHENKKGEIEMKVKNVTDVEKFFKVIDECKGRVELVTDEGDRLNLKSKLTQYVALASVFKDATIGEMELIAHEPEDVQKLVMFMYDGEA